MRVRYDTLRTVGNDLISRCLDRGVGYGGQVTYSQRPDAGNSDGELAGNVTGQSGLLTPWCGILLLPADVMPYADLDASEHSWPSGLSLIMRQRERGNLEGCSDSVNSTACSAGIEPIASDTSGEHVAAS